jgi:hypothetical protein
VILSVPVLIRFLDFLSFHSTTGRRFKSTLPIKEKTFREIWLSDPSTYPVIAVCGIAAIGVMGFTSTKMMTDPAIHLTPTKKNSILRL